MCVGIRCVVGCCLTEIEARFSRSGTRQAATPNPKSRNITLPEWVRLVAAKKSKSKAPDSKVGGPLAQEEWGSGSIEVRGHTINYNICTGHPLSPCRLPKSQYNPDRYLLQVGSRTLSTGPRSDSRTNKLE